MNVDGIKLKIGRVEIVKKTYDRQSRVINEQVEFYYPEEIKSLIGFNMIEKCKGGKKK